MSQLCLFIAGQIGDFPERLSMKTPLGFPLGAVGFLKAGDDVVDGGIENLHLAAEVEAKDAGVLQEPVLRFLGVFGMAEGIRDNHRADATGSQQLVGAFEKGNVEVPLFPQGFVLLAGEDGLSLNLVGLALLIRADVGRIADGDVEAVRNGDAEHPMRIEEIGGGLRVKGVPFGDVLRLFRGHEAFSE